MLKNGWKSWITERHAKIQAEKDYEKEKETTIALLEKQKKELELTLTQYDLHNATIDYKGIIKLFFEGDYVHITTKSEQLTVRLKESADVFEFIKKIGIPNSYHSFIGREQWILTTNLSSGVNRNTIPKLDFLRIDDCEQVRLLLDLSKEVDVLSVKGIVAALHGKFSVSLNYERINEALMHLAKELNQTLNTPFKLKFDATDVRAFTFYAENDEGDSVDLSKLGSFDVEQLLLDRETFTMELLLQLRLITAPTANKLNAIKNERIKKEAIEQAKATLRAMEPLLTKVEIIFDKTRPTITFGRLCDPITIQADVPPHYYAFISNINHLNMLAQHEETSVRRFLNRLRIETNEVTPFSLEEGHINASINQEEASLLIDEVKEKRFDLSRKRVQNWIKHEHPDVQTVLSRFTFVEEDTLQPYSLTEGFINVFIAAYDYQQLIDDIRYTLLQILEFELSQTYKKFPINNASLFGVTVIESSANGQLGRVNFVTIKKTDGTVYEKYFKDGILLSSNTISEFKKM